jgi:hypothetical protein
MTASDPPTQSRAVRASLFILRQPSWVARLAVGAALLVFTAVIAVLVIPAAFAAVLIFLLAAGLLTAWLRVRALFEHPRDLLVRNGGRRNVRVIEHEDR